MLQTALTENIGYEGKVTLTLKSNDKILESKIYKNSGTAQLFNFLGLCLIGDYENAARLKPHQILLLANKSTHPIGADPWDVETKSILKPLTQVPAIINDASTGQVKVIYSFEVDKSSIEGPFNQIALYGSGMTINDYKDFSAYYYLTSNTGDWETQNISQWSATTVLLVEWELTISNNNTES